MGMYDTVIANCNDCHAEICEQIKHADQCLDTFHVGGSMKARHASFIEGMELICEGCGSAWIVKTNLPREVQTWLGKRSDPASKSEEQGT